MPGALVSDMQIEDITKEDSPSDDRLADTALLDDVMNSIHEAVDGHLQVAEQALKEQLASAAKALAASHECAATALAKTARKVTAEALRRGSISAVTQASWAPTHAVRLPHASEGKPFWKAAEVKSSAVEWWTVPGSLDPYLVNARADFDSTKIEKMGPLFAKTNIAHLSSVPVPPTLLAKRHAPVLHLPEQTPPSTAARAARDWTEVTGTNHNHVKAVTCALGSVDQTSRHDSSDDEHHRSRRQRSKSPDDCHLSLPVRPASADSRPTSASSRGKGHRSRVTQENHQKIMQHMPVFADAEAMKEKVRQAIGEQEYNVMDSYFETGLCQHLARHPLFESVTLAIISFNAIWIGIDCDYNDASMVMDASFGFQLVENFFCAFFVLEYLIRFGAFEKKRDGLMDAWFVFDGILALLMVMEVWVFTLVLHYTSGDGTNTSGLGNASILKLVRLVRLFRMARMVRLLRAIPELMTLIKGMAVAARSVFFTLCLLVMFLYVFGVAFSQLTKDTDVGSKYFDSVGSAMNTLLLYGALLEDTPDVINAVGAESWFLRALFLIFVLLAALTVMNMLVGVIVEVVSVVSAVEKETIRVNFFRHRLQSIIKDSKLDEDGNGQISRSEFETLLANPEAARSLKDVGVDVIGLVDYQDYFFKDGEEFDFAAFVEVVLSLRGGNSATVKDLVDLRKFIVQEGRRVDEKFAVVLYETQQVNKNLRRSVRDETSLSAHT